MSESLILALVASSSAILGSVVTGWFTYVTSVKQRQAEKYKRRLLQAYKDIAALHRLEERYTKALASATKTADAWKREMRRIQRDEGFDSPSEEATSQRAEQRMSDLA